MRNFVIATTLGLFLTLGSYGQSTLPSAVEKQTSDLCEQRLLKALDALEKAERLVTALEAENAALRRLNAVNEQILVAKETVISEQIKLIEIYKKQSGRKISFLFGLVKIRY